MNKLKLNPIVKKCIFVHRSVLYAWLSDEPVNTSDAINTFLFQFQIQVVTTGWVCLALTFLVINKISSNLAENLTNFDPIIDTLKPTNQHISFPISGSSRHHRVGELGPYFPWKHGRFRHHFGLDFGYGCCHINRKLIP